jgi:hypothetical protein
MRIVHEPAAKPAVNPQTRDTVLGAISEARGWIEDLRVGRAASLAAIAVRESLGERRHVRLLAPLAFAAPTIADGTAPARLTVTALARRLLYSWIEPEQRILRP